MNRTLFFLRFSMLIALTVIAADSNQSFAQDERPDQEELPLLEQMQLPTAEMLQKANLDDRTFDWLVLKPENRVLVVSPLYPRPDTLKRREEERSSLESSNPKTAEERKERTERLAELRSFVVNLPGDAVTEYKIPVTAIERVILFEELCLQQVDQLTQAGEIRKAYDLLLVVDSQIPNWEQSLPRFENVLLADSEKRAQAGDIYTALALLDELAARKSKNAEVEFRFGTIIGGMIATAVEQKQYRKARFLMNRLQRYYPDHLTISEWTKRLTQLSGQTLNEAMMLVSQGKLSEAAIKATEADTIWPLTGNQRGSYAQIIARNQRLRVGVDSFSSDQIVYPGPQPAQARHLELVEVPLFEPSTADEIVFYKSSFFEKWVPSDLGRELVMTLRESRPHWQSQPVLTANQIADAISHQLDMDDPLYNPRLASFVKEFSVRSPTELKLKFSRVPLSIESLLRFPVVVANPELSQTADTDVEQKEVGEQEPHLLLSTRFQQSVNEENRRLYVRVQPEPEGLAATQYHVAEIEERKFADRHQMIQALVRGEIDYIPSLRPWEVDAVRASPDFHVEPYAIPVNHVIVFNPNSKNITSAQQRRALSLAIDREAILKNVVLRDQTMKYGRTTSSAWRKRSYATNPLETSPPYDIRLAFALRFAAEKQLQIAELAKLQAIAEAKAKEEKSTEPFDPKAFRAATDVSYIKLPKLRLVVEPDELAKLSAERIVNYWRKIQFDVDIVIGDQAGNPLPDSEWDLMYRTVRMEEPLFDLWQVMTNDTTFDVRRLDVFPDWMRQELINLDYAPSFVDAQAKLFTIHRHMAAQAFLIPLWEFDEFAAFQKDISGYSSRPVTPYQNVERWLIKP
ncbi:MAG: hypothetical protein JNL58_15895 [Planctomyces sp.]|nr:hypothetical protein [Planctomyces sp.]